MQYMPLYDLNVCFIENGILLQPSPRDNGNYPPEGCIVLPEGRRRPALLAFICDKGQYIKDVLREGGLVQKQT